MCHRPHLISFCASFPVVVGCLSMTTQVQNGDRIPVAAAAAVAVAVAVLLAVAASFQSTIVPVDSSVDRQQPGVQAACSGRHSQFPTRVRNKPAKG